MIIFALGNTEPQYTNTRHNVGKDVINKLASDLEVDFRSNNKLDVEFAKVGESYIVKPLLLMNINGKSLLNFVNYYLGDQIRSFAKPEILVVYDDLDLQVGEFKFTKGSYSKIHNGIRSLKDNGFDLDKLSYLKIGVRSKNLGQSVKKSGIDPSKFVLQQFDKDELVSIDNLYSNTLKCRLLEMLA